MALSQSTTTHLLPMSRTSLVGSHRRRSLRTCTAPGPGLKDEERYWVPIDNFVENMTQLINLASEVSDKVILLGSAGIDEAKTHPYTYRSDIESSNADIARYDDATAEVAGLLGATFVPVLKHFIAADPNTMLYDDGVHPNGRGHQFIADLVWPHVAEWL